MKINLAKARKSEAKSSSASDAENQKFDVRHHEVSFLEYAKLCWLALISFAFTAAPILIFLISVAAVLPVVLWVIGV
jgi:hypothetical protein